VAAQELRRLLHYGSVISIHVVGLLATFPDQALVLRQFAKLAMAAAGSPGHFPTTAIPGGVTTPVVAEKRTETLDMVPQALEAARAVWESVSVLPSLPDHFEGADVALVDERGNLDLFGEYLRVVGGGGGVLIDSVASDHWDSMVAETDAGSSAPRPYLLPLGPDQGAYRVGPVAQLRVAPLGTPHSARLQKQWLQSGGGAPQARATIILHCVEVIEQILTDPILILDKVAVPWKEEFAAGVGVGWVDGARGLLVHRYQTGERGVVESAQILTPTAQNEPWLASLLTQAASGSTGNVHHMEAAIREADPCLPCSSAPVGAMGLVVDTDVRG
jgi:NAD-reducing hydrogenase large subunit